MYLLPSSSGMITFLESILVESSYHAENTKPIGWSHTLFSPETDMQNNNLSGNKSFVLSFFRHFFDDSDNKESTWNAGDLNLIPG